MDHSTYDTKVEIIKALQELKHHISLLRDNSSKNGGHNSGSVSGYFRTRFDVLLSDLRQRCLTEGGPDVDDLEELFQHLRVQRPDESYYEALLQRYEYELLSSVRRRCCSGHDTVAENGNGSNSKSGTKESEGTQCPGSALYEGRGPNEGRESVSGYALYEGRGPTEGPFRTSLNSFESRSINDECVRCKNFRESVQINEECSSNERCNTPQIKNSHEEAEEDEEEDDEDDDENDDADDDDDEMEDNTLLKESGPTQGSGTRRNLSDGQESREKISSSVNNAPFSECCGVQTQDNSASKEQSSNKRRSPQDEQMEVTNLSPIKELSSYESHMEGNCGIIHRGRGSSSEKRTITSREGHDSRKSIDETSSSEVHTQCRVSDQIEGRNTFEGLRNTESDTCSDPWAGGYWQVKDFIQRN